MERQRIVGKNTFQKQKQLFKIRLFVFSQSVTLIVFTYDTRFDTRYIQDPQNQRKIQLCYESNNGLPHI